MQLVINPLIGKRFFIDVNHSDTINTIKTKIKNSQGIPVNKQMLICRNQTMNNGRKLENYPDSMNDRQIRLRIINTNKNSSTSGTNTSGGNKGRKIYKGPRGGKYYMKGGNKVYIK